MKLLIGVFILMAFFFTIPVIVKVYIERKKKKKEIKGV